MLIAFTKHIDVKGLIYEYERRKKRREREEREKRKKERREETGKEREGDGKREEKESRRERGARLVWRKGLSPEIEVKKTMNAGGVENRID
ncbi:hypothetical protein TNCV_2370121 [Trichonephila clavipes]|nr:hypothetical protein TNCV_2370121 [Trichonephila clavipes]